MKDGILSQILTERGYFVLLKQLMKYKRVLKIQNKKITIKIRGVWEKNAIISSTYYVRRRVPAQIWKWLEGLRTLQILGWNKIYKERKQRWNHSFTWESCSAIGSYHSSCSRFVFCILPFTLFLKLKCFKRPREFNSVNTLMLYQTCNLI